MESFTAPVSGQYKMECWGAQGGTLQSFHKPGRGGYCMGYHNMEQGELAFVCCGNCGAYGTYSYNNNLGINLRYGMPGGGATHISINSGGELKNFSSHPTDILLVAGGGGSSDMTGDVSAGIGGHGGGVNGTTGSNSNESYNKNGTGASQSTGGITGTQYAAGYYNGSFGLGGVGWNSNPDYGAQGGAGYYGGGGCAQMGTSGGGSSYLGGVTGGQTIAGDSEMPAPSGGTEIGHSDVGVCHISWFLE